MSRGRPHHQASRRKTYSARQREVRERESRASREDRSWETGPVVPLEVDEGIDPDMPSAWPVRLPGTSSAA